MSTTETVEKSKESQHARHIKAVVVSAEFLFQILKTSEPRMISCEGVPNDAVAFRIAYDSTMDQVIVFYEHPSFPLSTDGLAESMTPKFTEYRGCAAIKAVPQCTCVDCSDKREA